MKLPAMTELNTSREMIDAFRGYNHNLRIGSGEFYDMTNLTSDDYPVLSPRRQRGIYQTDEPLTNPQGLIAKDALCYVEDGRLYINQERINDTENCSMELYTKCDDCPIKGECGNYCKGSTSCKKTMISMGAYIIIMPDKKYINTANHTDCGKIEAEVTIETGKVSFELSKVDGADYENTVVSPSPPVISEEMLNDASKIPLWLDTSGTPHSLKQYSTTNSMWTPIATTYIKISYPNIGSPFSVNDGVTISGITPELADLNNTMVVRAVGENYLIVTGIIDHKIEQEATEENPIRITRKMPSMDFIIESENRLWGCRYGLSNDGTKVVNEIYASKLGDFKNWNCFDGISTDSYAASVGTDGQFTGAITHLGYPLFFKENCVHKVYGNYPANYQIQTTTCRGVQKGCSKSLAIVNETLYYKAKTAICAYDGSLPVEMSSALGDATYSNAVAGSLGNKYYISMADENEDYHLFVYDALKGMWHREDDTQATEFCTCRGDLYYIDHADDQIKTVRGSGVLDTTAVKWEAITGVIGTDSPDKKYISRMDVRLSLGIGTKVTFFVEYDSSGTWEHLFTMEGTSLRSFAVPIRPKRCDHMRLKISGHGEAKVYSICKTIEQGSDV